jgi:hypothetical protein
MRHPSGNPYSTDRVDDANETLRSHAEWLINDGRVGKASVLSEAYQILVALRNVRPEEKPPGPVFPRRA